MGSAIALPILAAASWGFGIAISLATYTTPQDVGPTKPQIVQSIVPRSPSLAPSPDRPLAVAEPNREEPAFSDDTPPQPEEDRRAEQRERMKNDVLDQAEEAFDEDMIELIGLAMDERDTGS